MKRIHYYFIAALLIMLSACESDLLKTTITDGTAPQLTASSTQIVLTRPDSANVALSLSWTNPNYLVDTENGNVVGLYFIEIAKNASFDSATVIAAGNLQEWSFSVYRLNKILLDMKCETDVANDISVRVKSVFFSSDTLISNVANLSISPYATVIPPEIAVPDALYIIGDALSTGWNTPLSEDQKLTKETPTIYSITIDLIANKAYALITDVSGSNWTPCYRLDPAVDPATVVNGGKFVWDGDGSDYGWSTVNFLSPPNDGTYKLTFNFQDASYTVVDVSGPPAIEVPEELWIWGDGLEGGWINPFPAERQFAKVGKTKFSITIFIAASTDYEMIVDGTGANWTPCYRIDPALDRNEMIWEGSFVWDGEGSQYSWGSKKFLSPPEDGTYTLTFDFQTATFRVVAK